MLTDLAKTALLGTDRADLTVAQKTLLAAQGIDIEADSTQVLLEAIALYAQKEKAGFLLRKLTEELPPAAEDTDEYACSDNSAQHLQQILNGKFLPALPEFVKYLSQTKYRAPAEMLPEIIENQLSSGKAFLEFEKIIGRRGAWLMRQNPAWHRHLPLDDVELWATGNEAERLAVLRFLRDKYPELAVEMLLQSWHKEPVKNKTAFLEVLAENTSAGDETFLETCLDEKNEEVRALAAMLLAKIPTSAFVQRLSERLKKYVYFTSEQLEVNPPEATDAAGLRDTLFGEIKSVRQGMRAAWLTRMVAFLPPAMWERHFEKTPRSIIKSFAKSNYMQVLFGSVLAATRLHRNEDWTAALLNFAMDNATTIALPDEDISGLVSVFSDEKYNAFLAKRLEVFPLTEQSSPLLKITAASTNYLDAQNTETIINQYRKFIAHGGNQYGSHFRQKELLKVLAYQADFTIYDRLKTGWDMNSPLWRSWADEVEAFMRTLQFRRAMREGLLGYE